MLIDVPMPSNTLTLSGVTTCAVRAIEGNHSASIMDQFADVGAAGILPEPELGFHARLAARFICMGWRSHDQRLVE